METAKKTTKTKEENQTQTSFYVKMLDYYIEQVDKATPEVLSAMENMQDFYTSKIKIVLDAGRKIEDQSKNKLSLISKGLNIFEDTMSVMMKIQRVSVNMSLKTNNDIAKMARNNLAALANKKSNI